MCFTVSVEKKAKEAIRNYLNSNAGVQLKIDFDTADYHLVSGFAHPKLPIIKQGSIELSEWGLIPSFAVTDEIQKNTLNAKGETIFEKPSFKKSIKNQRCVLMVDGFFEWRHEKGKKIPYYIFPKDGTVFCLGCIYNSWVNKITGEVKDTFSIITTEANPFMEYIHNTKKRMPLILDKVRINEWINPETPATNIKQMMKPYDESGMDAYEISQYANNSRNNRNVPEIKKKKIN